MARILFTKPSCGKYYALPGISPHLKIVSGSGTVVMKGYIKKYISSHTGQPYKVSLIRFLDVGGRHGRETIKEWSEGAEYFLLDTQPRCEGENIIVGDICNCPQITDNSFDIVFSDNVFEHISEPWKAAQEIGRILKSGGLCLTRTLFSWRYHPCPEDYWRYTHSSLRLLFEKYAGLETVECGYDIGNRRVNFAGGKVKRNLDGVPIDGYGGWLENWMVFHIGLKPESRK